MKPLRVLNILVTVMLGIALITGCSNQKEYELLNDASLISEIQIVWVGERSEGEYVPSQTVLSVVENTDSFVDELLSVDSELLYPPASIPLDAKAVKIIYNNGDYELLTYCGQAYYRADEDFYQSCAGCEYFDKNQFNALIEKYS